MLVEPLRLFSFLGLLLAILGFTCPSGAVAQESGRLIVSVGAPGRQDIPLAIPNPKGADSTLAREFASVLVRDLEISGWFRILDPAAFLEPPGAGLRPGEFSFSDWTIPGAAVLAKTRIDLLGQKLRAEVWIYDVAGARKLDARAFSGSDSGLRSVAHHVANAIIKAVTGTDSIFNTRFAAVNNRTGNKEIYLVDIDGHGAIPVTRNGSINLQPSWSPDGTKLIYTSYRAGNPDLYLADLAKATTRRISARTGLNIGAAWSPLGNLLSATLSNGGNSDIFTLDPYSGKVVARLTTSSGIDASPSWSPGGSQIAFVSDRSGGAQIYVMSANGSNIHRVSFHGTHNTDPSWSPAGDRLAYVTREKHFDIITCDLDGRSLVRITQGQGDNEDPSWSPDGRYLSFSSTRTGTSHIWISTADGYHQIQVTRDKGGWSNPSWSPSLDW